MNTRVAEMSRVTMNGDTAYEDYDVVQEMEKDMMVRDISTLDDDVTDEREASGTIVEASNTRVAEVSRVTGNVAGSNEVVQEKVAMVGETSTVAEKPACLDTTMKASQTSKEDTDLESQAKPLTEFALFSRLPPELKLRIWRLASEIPRDVHFQINILPRGYYDEEPYLLLRPAVMKAITPPPAVLHVCKDSRDEGLKKYKRCMTMSIGAQRTIYGNPSKDTFFIDFETSPYWEIKLFLACLKSWHADSGLSPGDPGLVAPWNASNTWVAGCRMQKSIRSERIAVVVKEFEPGTKDVDQQMLKHFERAIGSLREDRPAALIDAPARLQRWDAAFKYLEKRNRCYEEGADDNQ